MNGWDWQLVVTLIIVAWATLALTRRATGLLIAPERSGCSGGGCGGCSSADSGVDQSVVQLQVVDATRNENKMETL